LFSTNQLKIFLALLKGEEVISMFKDYRPHIKRNKITKKIGERS